MKQMKERKNGGKERRKTESERSEVRRWLDA
jgi:hypothetical protein